MNRSVLIAGLGSCLFFAVGVCVAQMRTAGEHKVERDLVQRAETAIAIARAVSEETYGREDIKLQLPLQASRRGASWYVHGSLPAGVPGGVVEVWISVSDGRIVRLTHGK